MQRKNGNKITFRIEFILILFFVTEVLELIELKITKKKKKTRQNRTEAK